MVATEVLCTHHWQADVLASNGKKVIEIEIKTSMSDLKTDFANKGGKHEALTGTNPSKFTCWVNKDKDTIPNEFYFAVPECILKKAYAFLKDTPYGLICIPKQYNYDDYVHTIKTSSKFNTVYPVGLEKLILHRMSSEIIILRKRILELKKEFNNPVKREYFNLEKVLKE